MKIIVDTILTAGNYYLKAVGKGSKYAPAYASLGSYSLNANIKTGILRALPKLKLNDLQNGGIHQLNWIIEGDKEMAKQLLEVSIDENDFIELNQNTIHIRSYIYRPVYGTNIQYRLKIISDDIHSYFSNRVILKKMKMAPGHYC